MPPRHPLTVCPRHGCKRVPTGVGRRTRCPECHREYVNRYRATEKGKKATRRYNRSEKGRASIARRRASNARRDAARRAARAAAGLCRCGRQAAEGFRTCSVCAARDRQRRAEKKRAKGLCVEPYCLRTARKGWLRCEPCHESRKWRQWVEASLREALDTRQSATKRLNHNRSSDLA